MSVDSLSVAGLVVAVGLAALYFRPAHQQVAQPPPRPGKGTKPSRKAALSSQRPDSLGVFQVACHPHPHSYFPTSRSLTIQPVVRKGKRKKHKVPSRAVKESPDVRPGTSERQISPMPSSEASDIPLVRQPKPLGVTRKENVAATPLAPNATTLLSVAAEIDDASWTKVERMRKSDFQSSTTAENIPQLPATQRPEGQNSAGQQVRPETLAALSNTHADE